MGERSSAPQDSPLHLPPRHEWKPKHRYIFDSTVPLLDLPVDDRGFVKPDEVIATVKDWFVPGYDWSYDPDNDETRVDDHHFHGEAADYKKLDAHYGSSVPTRFRNNPFFVGRMYRPAHNAIHRGFKIAQPPELDPMVEFLDRWDIAIQSHKRLQDAARSTLDAYERRLGRKRTLKKFPSISSDEDEYGQWLLNHEFEKNFAQYQIALTAFKAIEHSEILIPGKVIKLERASPQQVIRAGKAVAKKAIDYTDDIAA